MSTPAVSPVFVGRSAELSTLMSTLADAHDATPGVVLIGGEAGVGKTRLLDEFLAAATAQGAAVAVGGCLELGAEGLPFAPISAALRMLSAELGPVLTSAVAGREKDLAWLLPDLSVESFGLPAANLDRTRLFELTLSLLERLSEDRVLVVAVEDLHWADTSTRELLAFLVRSMRRGRILLVATYRADAIDRRHPMRAFVAELDRIRIVQRMELGRLTRAQVAELLGGLLGEEPPRKLARQVFQKSEGNAFFVEELVVGMRDGRLAGMSDTLRDLLLIRVEELPDDGQRIVRLAAVAGETVQHRLLTEVAGYSPERVDDAVRAAVSRHILRTTPDGAGYQFRHALVREAVRSDLLPGERMRIHADFGEALERCPEIVPCDELHSRRAAYWYYAGRPAKALPAVLKAAYAARSRYAFGEELSLFERAMELWEQVPDPEELTGRTLPSILEDAIPAARFHNAHDRALAFIRQALDLVDADAEPRRAADLLVDRARMLRSLGRASGNAELKKAQVLLAGLEPSDEHARVLSQIARDQMLDGPTEDALALSREALRIAESSGSTDLHATVLKTQSCLLVNLGHVEEGMRTMLAAIDVAQCADEPDTLCVVFGNQSSLLEGLGRHQESVDAARQALSIARERGLIRNIGAFTIGNLSESLWSIGEWDELETLADDALEHDPKPQTAGHISRILAELALARGDVTTARRHLDIARRPLSGSYVEPQFRMPTRAAEISFARRVGQLGEVRELLRLELEAGFPAGHQRYAWPLLVEAVRAEGDATELASQQRPAEVKAREEIVTAVAEAAAGLQLDCDLDRAQSVTLRAELARARGESGVEDWERVVEAWRGVEQPYTLARVLSKLGAARVAAGDRAGAAQVLAEAHALTVRLGAVPLQDEIELLARRARIALDGRAGEPTMPEPVEGGPVLTPREQDVLRLVAEGRSNRQIAETLFISAKTASVHVSNILGKLEVANRGEAAALARRLNLLEPVPTRAAG